MAWAAVAIGVGALGAGIAGAVSAPDAPEAPNYAAANKAAIDADISTLALRRAIEQSAKLGKPITYTDPQTGETETFDFTRLGDAETSSANADKMAAAALELQKKYGPEFIKQAREQLKLADPEGFSARDTLYQEIMDQLGVDVNSPVADSLEAQILAELQQGGATDDATNREIDQYLIGQQLDRGGSYGKADEFQRALGVGQAAEARRTARQQKAAAFLSGGFAKADRDYKKGQQDLANLGAFLGGQTPTAQFQQLSGAQNGAAPFVGTTPGPGLNPNAGAQGAQGAQNQYNIQLANQQNNPWMQGLGMGLQTIGTVAAVGGQQGFGWWGAGKKP